MAFVEAPALLQEEVKMDPKVIAENEKELDAANKTVIPDDAGTTHRKPLCFALELLSLTLSVVSCFVASHQTRTCKRPVPR